MRLWLASLVVAAGSLTASPAGALGLLAVGRTLVFVEQAVGICLPERKPELGPAFVAMKAAMTKNALLLHPDRSPDAVAAEVDAYVETSRSEESSGPSSSCTEPIKATLNQQLGAAKDSTFIDGLTKLAAILGPYDVRAPFGGEAGAPLTFALSASQHNLLRMIDDNQSGNCPKPEIDDVVLVSRKPLEPLHLPPFILPPLQYNENWTVHCGSQVRTFAVTFNQDSEGPSGLAEVAQK